MIKDIKIGDWTYHTRIRPRKRRTDGDEGNNEYKEEFGIAFDKFLKECQLSQDFIYENLVQNASMKYYRHEILTDYGNDEVDTSSDYHVVFLKSRFLSNPLFKKKLIEYYNPLGFFIKGPIQLQGPDGNVLDKWGFELRIKY